MKLVIVKQELVKAVNTVSKAVPTRTTMPILECIYIDAQDGKIKFSGNDLELGIDTKVDGTVEERGCVCVNAKLFGDIVRKLPDGDVTISTDENLKTIIKCGKSKFELVGKDGKDFSYVPLVETENAIQISEFSLKEMVKQVVFSAKLEDTSPQKLMSGVCIEIKENQMRCTALDGHRIAIRKITLKQNYAEAQVVIPAKVLTEISKIIPGDAEEMVEMSFSTNNVVFKFRETVVVSRLLEGNYFKVDQMISSAYDTKVTLSRQELQDSLDRSTLLVKEGDKKPIIMDVKTDGTLKLKMKSFIGTMNETIETTTEGKDLLIGFNPNFFIDALRAVDDEKVSLYMVNPKAPCMIKDDADTYLYLILPVNFNAAEAA